jgi:hypothetical protein
MNRPRLPRRFQLGPVTVIRWGACRTVYLIGPWAVKVPALRLYDDGLAGLIGSVARGIQANLSERALSPWDELQGRIAPVLWSAAGVVNVYPRCEQLPTGRVEEVATFNWPPCGDRKAANLGLLAGRVVAVDYDGSWNGCPHTPWNDLSSD